MGMLELVNSKGRQLASADEYYNSVRANIQFSGIDLKTIVLTSVQPNEGKTTTSTGLAMSFATAGYKTLLIDADTRNSVLSGTFTALGAIEGLTSYLSGNASLGEVICDTNVPNLLIIPSGKHTPNPTRLIQNDRFSDMMEKVRTVFDYVIVDSPPIGLVVDAAIIAQKCDGVVLVTGAGSVKRRFLLKAKEQMEMSGAQFLGVVLNKVDVEQSRYGSYGNYGIYGSYVKATEKKAVKHRRIRKEN